MSTNDSPVIVGLTGGIASGKSTVTNMLRERGVEVLDADQIAREIVRPGEEALDEIVAAFGPGVLTASGELDRTALGERIFADAEARQTLNMITHPRIGQRMMQRALEAHARGHRWVVYDAALLVENNLHRWLDSLIVVAAAPETQVRRIVARDGLDEAAARARLAAQMPLAEKVAVADYVVDNEGSLEATRRQVDALYDTIEARVRAHGTARPASDSSPDRGDDPTTETSDHGE